MSTPTLEPESAPLPASPVAPGTTSTSTSAPAPGLRSVTGPDTLALVLAIAAGAVGVLLLTVAIPRVHPLIAGFPYDFIVDHIAARGFLDHLNPFTDAGAHLLGLERYGNAGSGHPPTTAFWALPVARLTPQGANTVIAWLTVLLLLITCVGISTTLAWPAPLAFGWLAFAYVMSCSFMPYHLAAGQFSTAIGFLYFVCWRAGRRGDDVLSGIALGLACTMKFFPGVVALFFLVQRRWTALIAASAAYLAIAAVMTSRFGLASWPYFLAKQSLIAKSWMASIQNQSLHGVVLRWFLPSCEGRHGLSAISSALSTGMCIALLALAAWWTPRRRGAARDANDVAFALFVALSVIVSPWSWEHYTVIFVLPAAVLLDQLARSWMSRRRRARDVALLLFVAAAIAAWHIDLAIKLRLGRDVLGGRRDEHLSLHVFEVLYWAPGFALAAMLFAVARHHARAAHAAPGADSVSPPPRFESIDSRAG